MPSRASHTAAVQLLTKVVAEGSADCRSLATALVVSESTVSEFLRGRTAMPLDRQLCLALFVIDEIPALAREGRRLRAQVRAAMAFHLHVTETHIGPPPREVWPR